MGLVGVHYDLRLFKQAPSMYLGIGGYGAARGEEGGFFTTGVTLGWKPDLFDAIRLDTGVHLGAGGGSSRPADQAP